MSVILHGMCYGEPISEVCEDIDEAVAVAISWMPGPGCTIGSADPRNITDSEGNEVMSKDDLSERLSWIW